MALSTLSKPLTAKPGGMLRAAIVSYNGLMDEVRALCVLLDADATVADTNYTALLDAGTGVTKVLDINGTAITA